MKTIHLRNYDSTTLREAIPFWFALASPLIGLRLGLFGAWLFAWLTT